jgi:acetamidase/formamidase
MSPFMGVMGVAPLRRGMYRTMSPMIGGGMMGGNTDVKQFVKGSRVQYPVFVEGGRFSVGDGHAAQGDGEVCVAAIETAMSFSCRFRIIKDTILAAPRAIVPLADPTSFALTKEMLGEGFYHTMGAGPDLIADAKNALRDMVDWVVQEQGLSIHEAYTICSVAGDLKLSEVVGVPNWVVSMTLPRGIFEA